MVKKFISCIQWNKIKNYFNKSNIILNEGNDDR